MIRRDTWPRRVLRWTCTCGAINPDITRSCIRCGK